LCIVIEKYSNEALDKIGKVVSASKEKAEAIIVEENQKKAQPK
jgi:hypothetical protein